MSSSQAESNGFREQAGYHAEAPSLFRNYKIAARVSGDIDVFSHRTAWL
jgi:hypothetical protein